jgi:hypothetical protein
MPASKIWYCLECGDYSFSPPERQSSKLRGTWICDVCQLEGVVDLDATPNRRLTAMARDIQDEWPSGRFDDDRPYYRPLNYLLKTLRLAKGFINVATESMDGFFLGVLALKQTEPDIEQRVIIWHPQRLYQDFGDLMDHSTIVKGYERRENYISRGLLIATVSRVHQKLFIIDGCIAFKGSANASLDAWTGQGNLIEFVTDPHDIQKLNRRYFARYMAKKRTGSNDV